MAPLSLMTRWTTDLRPPLFTSSLIIHLMDPEDVDAYSMNLGWKTIGVFGYLRLHGQVCRRSWHKLGATVEVGTGHITLAEDPDASWLNKEVGVTTTGKEATESEVRRVVAINGATLTLDSALKFQHLGSAQVDGVEFRNMGQEGFTDITDPRYSIAFLGLDAIGDHSSYVKRSSFNVNYNVAVGLIKTLNMVVEENVIYHELDSGIRHETGSNTYRWNLITTVFFLGTYEDRQETENLNWSGAFQLDNAPNTVLTGNVVAGAEQAGYKTLGELCEDTTWWMGNEVHNAIYGVMLWKKGGTGPLTDCCRLNNFYTWRISDTGFYVQHYASSLITNVVSVDSPLGAMQIIYEPDSLSHKFHPKTANASHSLFVGVSPSHTCEYQASKSRIMKFYGDKFFGGGVGGGNTGVLLASFTSGSNKL
ncbi:fibrocystin-L-like isoform X2 [Scylla paramamosain]|uniref:fibrocystin-L-like isoform X2 n=1 Tax=Scylla paramamosain TaxID=85552 RepID=UPI003083A7EE